MTTEREQILALAAEHGATLIQQSEWGSDFDTTKLDPEAFYHAARKPLEEEIEALKVEYVKELDVVSVRNYELRQQLAEKDAEIGRITTISNNYYAILVDANQNAAAAQAQIIVYREALEYYQSTAMTKSRADLWEPDDCVANDALAQPANTSALEACIKRAGEVMRERTKLAVAANREWAKNYEAIRALPGVTLEDLK